MKDPQKGQYASELHYKTEFEKNMNHGSSSQIADAARLGHRMVVEHKVIKSTALTERRNEIGPRVDVTKNYSRLPKTMNDPQPNDAGEPVSRSIYKKSAQAGTAKGGIKYKG